MIGKVDRFTARMEAPLTQLGSTTPSPTTPTSPTSTATHSSRLSASTLRQSYERFKSNLARAGSGMSGAGKTPLTTSMIRLPDRETPVGQADAASGARPDSAVLERKRLRELVLLGPELEEIERGVSEALDKLRQDQNRTEAALFKVDNAIAVKSTATVVEQTRRFCNKAQTSILEARHSSYEQAKYNLNIPVKEIRSLVDILAGVSKSPEDALLAQQASVAARRYDDATQALETFVKRGIGMRQHLPGMGKTRRRLEADVKQSELSMRLAVFDASKDFGLRSGANLIDMTMGDYHKDVARTLAKFTPRRQVDPASESWEDFVARMRRSLPQSQ